MLSKESYIKRVMRDVFPTVVSHLGQPFHLPLPAPPPVAIPKWRGGCIPLCSPRNTSLGEQVSIHRCWARPAAAARQGACAVLEFLERVVERTSCPRLSHVDGCGRSMIRVGGWVVVEEVQMLCRAVCSPSTV